MEKKITLLFSQEDILKLVAKETKNLGYEPISDLKLNVKPSDEIPSGASEGDRMSVEVVTTSPTVICADGPARSRTIPIR